MMPLDGSTWTFLVFVEGSLPGVVLVQNNVLDPRYLVLLVQCHDSVEGLI